MSGNDLTTLLPDVIGQWFASGGASGAVSPAAAPTAAPIAAAPMAATAAAQPAVIQTQQTPPGTIKTTDGREIQVVPQSGIATAMADYWPVIVPAAIIAGYGLYALTHRRTPARRYGRRHAARHAGRPRSRAKKRRPIVKFVSVRRHMRRMVFAR